MRKGISTPKVKKKIKSVIKIIKGDYISRLFYPQCRIRTDEVIIASFPRSGRTWVRFFIANYLNEYYKLKKDVSWENFAELSPGPLCDKESGLLNYPENIPRVIFSHNWYIAKHFKNRRVVYITRNFLDILISCYFFRKYRDEDFPKSISINQFIQKEFNFKKAFKRINFFSERLKLAKKIWILSYEKLRKNPKKKFRQLLDYLNFEYQEDCFEKSFYNSSFKQMHKDETLQKKYKSKEKFHTRKGKIKDYDEYLNDDIVNFVKEKASKQLKGLLKKYYLDFS